MLDRWEVNKSVYSVEDTSDPPPVNVVNKKLRGISSLGRLPGGE